MKPAELLDETRIVLGLDGGLSKTEVIRLLVRAALGHDGASSEHIATELVAREEIMTTGIGQGVAIPHTRSTSVERPAAALGVFREGIDFGAVDSEPVNIIFAFLTPEGEPRLHVETLAEAVRLFGRFDLRERIMMADEPSEVLLAIESNAA
jgi:mannitol/fructose-specific phosphotransferase system IIA component (Ntr-type)